MKKATLVYTRAGEAVEYELEGEKVGYAFGDGWGMDQILRVWGDQQTMVIRFDDFQSLLIEE